jgi:branched-chain amino acid transport system ATP-binding protein
MTGGGMTEPPLLAVAGLGVAYGPVVALRGVGISVAAGEAVALLGANGAGKSSLLRAIMGLVPVAAGTIARAGREIAALPPERRARLGLGYAPEGRRVFAGMSVDDNLDVACRGTAAERSRRRASVISLFPQLAEHAARRAWQLSGGQQQMLAVGRALMTGPRILLLDEPSLGLSPPVTADMFRAIREIGQRGITIVLVEQNVAMAMRISHRVCVLELGRIVAEGAPDDLIARPEIRQAYLGV